MANSNVKARGGEARARSLTPEQRVEIARTAAVARWDNSVPKATHTGTLALGELAIPCAVLPDGTRVLSQRGVGRALGKSFGGKDWKAQETDGAGRLPFFLAANSLKPYIPDSLKALLVSPIKYRQVGSGIALGIAASALPQICDVWLKAREAGALQTQQLGIAQNAEMLMRSLAHVGIVALVDEATGYQEVRDRLALQAILDQYLKKELAAWAKRFPDEFYKEMFRLKNWPLNPLQVRRPGVVGKYTNNIVYERLAPGILEELELRNPKDERGNRKGKHHQLLTDDIGHPALAKHLYAVIGFMRASTDWDSFLRLLDRAYPKKNDTLPLPFPDVAPT